MSALVASRPAGHLLSPNTAFASPLPRAVPARRSRAAATPTVCKAKFPTRGPLGGAIMGGVILGPVGALFGYFFGYGQGTEKTPGALEELREADRGLTPDMVDMAKELGMKLQNGEDDLRACVAYVEDAKDRVGSLSMSVVKARRAAQAAEKSGDEEEARTLLATEAERTSKLLAAEAHLENGWRRVEAARNALAALEAEAVEVNERIQRNIAITQARLDERPAKQWTKKYTGWLGNFSNKDSSGSP